MPVLHQSMYGVFLLASSSRTMARDRPAQGSRFGALQAKSDASVRCVAFRSEMGGFRVKGVHKQNVTRVDPIQQPAPRDRYRCHSIVRRGRGARRPALELQSVSDDGRDPVSFRNRRAPVRQGSHDERPYCFILRHSVTVLIFSASAALRRLPPKRSRARSIMTCSCCWRSSVSSPERLRGF
jgi:hypothetical protein